MNLFQLNENITLHPLPASENYGLSFPPNTSQLVKELHCFRLSRHFDKPPGVQSTFYHGINIVRMLWPNERNGIQLYVEYNGTRVWNTYFLNVFQMACRGKDCCLTGPASSAKTFGIAVYLLISFYSAPDKTMGIITTTSGTASERRVWGEVKDLHRNAQFHRWMDFNDKSRKIGEIIEYLKCITFDSNKELMGGTKTQRDLRNGIVVIPVANDSSGEHAMATIMGTKNQYILWCVDEMPAMMDGILAPLSALAPNEWVQFIGIGNANTKSDPHGAACEPADGWDSINQATDRFWNANTLDVLFLHGEESPNDHPKVPKNLVEAKQFPFPYLSNELARKKIAINEGHGDYESGRRTIRYNRFAIGFWYGDDVSNTILSAEFIKRFNAHLDPNPFAHTGYTTYWSLDPAFASGGDANAITFIKVGIDVYGHMQVVFPQQSIEVNPLANTKQDYRKMVAEQVVNYCKQYNALPQNGTYEATGDGGMIGDEVSKSFGQMVQPVSALEASNFDKYKNIVTEYWYSIRDLIATGRCRGFNINSNYAKDLFTRRFGTSGTGKIEVEPKKDMKKRIRRSPDCGDSVVQAAHLVLQRVNLSNDQERKRRASNVPDFYFQLTEHKEDFAERFSGDYEESLL